MKTNKKAVLGFAVAMVVSLSVMQGSLKQNNNANLQQLSLGTAYMAGSTEGGTSSMWNQATNLLTVVAGATGVVALGAAVAPEPVITKTTAVVSGVVCGVSAL